MIVSAENHVGVCIVQSLINRPDLRCVTVRATRTEQRLVKIGERASRWVCCEVRPYPFLLATTLVAAADFYTFAVQRQYVPFPQVVAVEAILGISCGLTE